mmetsp:Transcript_24671/g.64300  ORF Transcript_24671/g.64300 Transcript_24671/m.64300 type:complete len:238 (-) Transcript_24671:1107-1820(-)
MVVDQKLSLSGGITCIQYLPRPPSRAPNSHRIWSSSYPTSSCSGENGSGPAASYSHFARGSNSDSHNCRSRTAAACSLRHLADCASLAYSILSTATSRFKRNTVPMKRNSKTMTACDAAVDHAFETQESSPSSNSPIPRSYTGSMSPVSRYSIESIASQKLAHGAAFLAFRAIRAKEKPTKSSVIMARNDPMLWRNRLSSWIGPENCEDTRPNCNSLRYRIIRVTALRARRMPPLLG